MKYVRIENGKVVEIIPEYALPIEKWYGTKFSSQCVEASDDVKLGYFYNEETEKFSEYDDVEILRQSKIAEISNICKTKINEGSPVELSDGKSENFSYTLADQANVSEMFTAVMAGATEYPYHANDSECKMYSAADIVRIYSTLSMMKTSQITYHNQLKQYVKSIENPVEIQLVQYGQELTGEYLESYNNLILQAKTQLEAVLAKIASQTAS